LISETRTGKLSRFLAFSLSRFLAFSLLASLCQFTTGCGHIWETVFFYRNPFTLAFSTQPSSQGNSGVVLNNQPVIQIQDALGNLVPTATNTVTLTAYSDPHCTLPVPGVFSISTNPVSTTSGSASFAGLTYTYATAVPGTIYIGAMPKAGSGLQSACSKAVTVNASYYLSAGGSDVNDGLSPGAPWLSPNHAVNCGDVITAASSAAYSNWNFYTGSWGTVSCPAGNNVAWLKCATFDTCKITGAAGVQGMWVDQSYWGVQGWEISTPNGAFSTCFNAQPNFVTPVNLTHIIFANDVANGCQGGGFVGAANGGAGASIDYFAVVGNIAYNTAQSSSECYSGIGLFEPIQFDGLAGTHIYFAGNLSYNNFNPDPCGGGPPVDGGGIILDSLSGGATPAYTQQILVDNNLLIYNGGRGFSIGGTGNTSAPVYLRHNTVYGNNGDTNQNGIWCGEIDIMNADLVQSFYDLAATSGPTGCGANPVYAFYVANGNGTDHFYNSWGYSASGTNNTSIGSPGFSYDPSDTFGTNPTLTGPADPGAPNCGLFASAPACFVSVVANFTPLTPAAVGYGYQTPSATAIHDSLFPQWLCNVNLPSGLVTMGCL